MSRKEARQFIREIMRDQSLFEEFEDRLELPEDPDEDRLRERAAEVTPVMGREQGYDFNSDEGFEALEELRESIESDELAEEELERVAGGFSKTGETIGAVTISVGTAGIACAVMSIVNEATNSSLSCM